MTATVPTDKTHARVDSQAATWILAYHQARKGDPWTLIELQWGHLLTAGDVIADPDIVEDSRRRYGRVLILDDFQRDIIDSVFDRSIREVYCKGNTGCGKGAAAAIAICVYFSIWDDSRVVITRDSHDRAVEVMFGEVARWWRRMARPAPGCELHVSWLMHSHHRDHAVHCVNPLTEEGFTGVHSPHVLFCFDEATAKVLEARFSLAATQATDFIAMANPRTTSGNFRRAFDLAEDVNETQTVMGPYGKRRLITVDGADMLNVKLKRLEKPIVPPGGLEVAESRYAAGDLIPDELMPQVERIIPGQTGYDVWLGHCANPDDRWVACFAHGRFPDGDPERQVIPGKWITPAQAEWNRWNLLRRSVQGRDVASCVHRLIDRYNPVQSFGLDVGGSLGGDESILTAGGQHGMRAQIPGRFDDAVDLCDWVIKTIRDEFGINLTSGVCPIGVDTIGIGFGISGIFRKRRVRVMEIRGNDASDVDPKRYANKRAEMYAELGARLNPGGEWKEGRKFMLPDCVLLRQELTAVEKIYSGDGFKFHITPKQPVPDRKTRVESIKEKIGRSPDRADSACYFWRAQQCVGASLGEMINAGFF